jgi:hypothetical protein
MVRHFHNESEAGILEYGRISGLSVKVNQLTRLYTRAKNELQLDGIILTVVSFRGTNTFRTLSFKRAKLQPKLY